MFHTCRQRGKYFFIKIWDVVGAFPRTTSDSDYRQIMSRPSILDGTFIHTGKVCLLKNSMTAAHDFGRRWSINLYTNLREFSSTVIEICNDQSGREIKLCFSKYFFNL